ncbi:hypothetical protein JIN77_08325 [Verrucomicrobiaceae bacterium R5-34]|uniref:Uncharacterized protein n=1 Tax=Oceaniferula flava TaxID=2800421 RepID=A0AAE2VDE2_9BACT|nr:hypothetical protein [Verrucomicrobiaceae bacterium R5-34]MBK1855986.1 hypothetical protein [Oceaniferula flavus]MBM1137293.1 hypothetical protein [Oceaniferula flavus]
MNNVLCRPLLSAVMLSLLLPSCGLFKRKKKIEVAAKPEVRLAGRIQSVNMDSKFVLIRRYGGWHVDEGEIVESRGGNRTANLRPTGEKLGEHIAADIRSGDAAVGDAVYIRRIAEKKEPSLLTADSTPSAPALIVPAPAASPSAPKVMEPIPVPPALPQKNTDKDKNLQVEEDQL